MVRAITIGCALVGVLVVASLYRFSSPASAAQENAAASSFSGKPILVESTNGVALTMERAEVRKLGSKEFLVGLEMKDAPYKLTNEQFGGSTVWVPVDAIKQIVELKPVDRDK